MLPYRTLGFALFFVPFLNLWFYDEDRPLPYDTHEPENIYSEVKHSSPSLEYNYILLPLNVRWTQVLIYYIHFQKDMK